LSDGTVPSFTQFKATKDKIEKSNKNKTADTPLKSKEKRE